MSDCHECRNAKTVIALKNTLFSSSKIMFYFSCFVGECDLHMFLTGFVRFSRAELCDNEWTQLPAPLYSHWITARGHPHCASALSLFLSLVLLEAVHPALIRLYREFEFRSSSSHRTEPADSFHADPARAHCRCVNTFAASFHRDSQRKYIYIRHAHHSSGPNRICRSGSVDGRQQENLEHKWMLNRAFHGAEMIWSDLISAPHHHYHHRHHLHRSVP